MYAIYHQIDRQKRKQEEKENEQNLVDELKQLEQKYNLLLRRDSYSTITTHDTEIIIETKTDRKHLMPITWAKNGKLPIEISVPEKTRKDQSLLDMSYENDKVYSQAHEPEVHKDDALIILQNTLFVDDEDELDLIFDDDQEEEMNFQRKHTSPPPLGGSLSSSESSVSVYTDSTSHDSDNEMNFHRSSPSRDVSLSSSDSGQSFYTDSASSRNSEDLVRFEEERFTRFEI